ncbi:class I SAM-dependent methyltransferase [Paraherbaspirillum soli]|uniref:Class I SAM-dependent methyltransferase n=1 Tax=Paraherbaspirillum soli TaxID=631222 RepID=A0ABW0M7W1_9BURK
MPAAFQMTVAEMTAASTWISRFSGLIPPGQVLDLACGGGRHAVLLAAQGLDVLAVDRDPAALAGIGAPGISTQQIDLEAGSSDALDMLFQPQRFTAVVVTNYLHRALFPLILRSVAEQGVLLYETFAAGNAQFGKPSNPDFLLQPGELLSVLSADRADSWRVLAFEDGYVEQPKPAMVQRLCAVKGQDGAAASLRIA